MRVWAVATTYNEADIIGYVVQHLWNEGVDRISVADASSDGTREILHDLGVTVYEDHERFHLQPHWINRLASAADEGDWIVPFDADEFWYALEGPLAEVLLSCPHDKLYARMFKHRDWDHRHLHPTALPKVAYRWSEQTRVVNGNHDVNLPGGMYGVVDLREFQYRGFEHFKRKIVERNQTLDPCLPAGDGFHHKRLAGLSDEELRREWDQIQAIETVYDPVPSTVDAVTLR